MNKPSAPKKRRTMSEVWRAIEFYVGMAVVTLGFNGILREQIPPRFWPYLLLLGGFLVGTVQGRLVQRRATRD